MDSLSTLVKQRRLLVAIGQKMVARGLIVAAEGNLSVRLGGFSYLVTPSGVSKGELKVQDLLEIDFSGRTAHGTPTTEWPLHAEIYALRPDVGAVCHAHSPWSTAFAAAGRPLDGSLLTETASLLPQVPVAARALPGTTALAASVRPLVAGHEAILLGGHGVVTMGCDLENAFALLETVERLAQVTLMSEIAAGQPPRSDEVVNLMKRATGSR